jgi:signal peptidase II
MAKFRNIALFVILILFDQLSKYTIRNHSGFYICNPNIAWGIKINQITFYLLWIFIIILLIWFLSTKLKTTTNKKIQNYKYQNPKNKCFKFCICNLFEIWSLEFGILLIISGAISNIIDRLFFGCVIDFVDLKIWPVFNLADMYITIGAVALLMEILNIKNKNDNEKFKNKRTIK